MVHGGPTFTLRQPLLAIFSVSTTLLNPMFGGPYFSIVALLFQQAEHCNCQAISRTGCYAHSYFAEFQRASCQNLSLINSCLRTYYPPVKWNCRASSIFKYFCVAIACSLYIPLPLRAPFAKMLFLPNS